MRTVLYIIDSVLHLILYENLCSNLTRTFSMAVTCSCIKCCTVLNVYIGWCTKYYAYENFQPYSTIVCVHKCLCVFCSCREVKHYMRVLQQQKETDSGYLQRFREARNRFLLSSLKNYIRCLQAGVSTCTM